MVFEYQNIKINYELKGEGDDTLVLLHGWGQNIAMMDPIATNFQSDYRTLILDFPGFGNSMEPLEGWTVTDYALMLEKLLNSLEIVNPILIGHSFGCRVAIKYANSNSVSKMVFTGAAGIRPKRTFKYYFKVYSYKLGKKLTKLPLINKLELGNNFGSADYQQTSGVMRQTFVNVVNEDLTDELPNIKCPVLLIWGKDDDATPLADGYKMEKLIPDAALIELDGTHYAYLENIAYFNLIVKEFIK